MRSLIDILDFSVAELEDLIKTACDIMAHPVDYAESARRKKLATLFFEPSTRTRLSFEAAMYELGGSVIGFSDAGTSSAKKGETMTDTVKVIEGFADIIAMRHPLEGAAFAASQKVSVPIINAGDGGHFHPTQTLTDLLTIKIEKGSLSGHTIGVCGDLKYGRTVHSLISAVSRYPANRFILISPKELALPDYSLRELDELGIEYSKVESLEEAIPQLDILYMTRIQRERFDSHEEYERLKDTYILDKKKIDKASPDLSILHPLPRVNEISTELDEDNRSCYFRQAHNGKYIRMALILKLLSDRTINEKKPKKTEFRCLNPRCITNAEPGLPKYSHNLNNRLCCAYCDSLLK